MPDKPNDDPGRTERKQLHSWKEIAAYLAKDLSIRTAQRWEVQDGLPIYREGVKVFAYTDELDEWRRGRIVVPTNGVTSKPQEAPESHAPSKAVRLGTWAAVAALLIVAIWAFRSSSPHTPPSPVRWGRLLVKATSEGGHPMILNPGHPAGLLAASPDGLKVYAINGRPRSVSVIHPVKGSVTQLSLSQDPGSVAMSADGKRLYIAWLAGDVGYIDTRTDKIVTHAIHTPGRVHELALTPDGKKLFMSMYHLGVWRAFTSNGEMNQVTDEVCPVHLELDPQGERLYVPYQCGGPTGRRGHDAVEVFDVTSEESLGIVSGPPLVGGHASASPDGRTVLLDGLDACEIPEYDHAGCPMAPTHVFHFLRLPGRQVVKSIAMPPRGVARFLDSSRVLFLGDSISVMNATQYTITESWKYTAALSNVALVPDRGKAYFGVSDREEVLGFEAESSKCSPPPDSLAAFYPGDGTPEDAVGGFALSATGGVRFGPGRVGQAFVLDGQSGHLIASSTGFYNFGGRDSSVAAYVKFLDLEGEMTIMDRTSSESALRARLAKTQDHHFQFEFATLAGGPVYLKSTTVAIEGQWYQLCVTKNDREVVLYINGVVEDRKALGTDRAAASISSEMPPLHLGASREGRGFLNGKLDEILFYDRALSGSEVRDLFELRESGPCRL
ncbi:MAG TPA: LamG-like jellyroll fold domain-containing protein [Bryobacteraceae bacterium]|nr:LamG-like jellyroll fold domain-containing protein [Bryobacteraceae bacterium]